MFHIMKTKLFSFKFLLLIVLSVFSSKAWGQITYSYTFNNQQFNLNNQVKTLGSRDWTITNNGGYYDYDATRGQQVWSSGNPASSMTLSTNGISGTIQTVKITTSGGASVVANVSACVGGASYGSAQVISATSTEYTFTGTSWGQVVISWNNTSAKALYFKKIEIIYSTSPSCAAPTVSTTSVAGLTSVAANISGNITDVGGGTTITARGIQHSTSNTLTSPTSVASGVGTGAFTSNLTGLTANTLYYYRAYATNDCATPQTGYSHTSGYPTFTTYALAPTVTTATAIGTYGFTANWSAPTQGNASMTYTLEYSTDNTFATGVTSVGSLSSTNRAVSGLLANTNYYYRVKIVNAAGDSTWSGIQAVTTLAPANHLRFNPAPPTTATVGANLTAFKVEARRPDNTVDTSVTGSVSLSRNIVTGTANLAGTTTANFVNGVATFDAVQFDAAGTYTIIASSGTLSNATSANIVISPNPAFGYFHSKENGNWSSIATWETSIDGIT